MAIFTTIGPTTDSFQGHHSDHPLPAIISLTEDRLLHSAYKLQGKLLCWEKPLNM